MTSLAERGYLADVNVWIALASDRHEHHDAARRWFDSCTAPVVFCRITQLAFLRLLTNPKVMGEETLNPSDDVEVYRRLASDERVLFTPEPSRIEDAWISLMTIRAASGSTWTDAYLAAFAMTVGLRLITFDKGMTRWPALEVDALAGPTYLEARWRVRLHHDW
jgi:hypothetical protein